MHEAEPQPDVTAQDGAFSLLDADATWWPPGWALRDSHSETQLRETSLLNTRGKSHANVRSTIGAATESWSRSSMAYSCVTSAWIAELYCFVR